MDQLAPSNTAQPPAGNPQAAAANPAPQGGVAATVGGAPQSTPAPTEPANPVNLADFVRQSAASASKIPVDALPGARFGFVQQQGNAPATQPQGAPANPAAASQAPAAAAPATGSDPTAQPGQVPTGSSDGTSSGTAAAADAPPPSGVTDPQSVEGALEGFAKKALEDAKSGTTPTQPLGMTPELQQQFVQQQLEQLGVAKLGITSLEQLVSESAKLANEYVALETKYKEQQAQSGLPEAIAKDPYVNTLLQLMTVEAARPDGNPWVAAEEFIRSITQDYSATGPDGTPLVPDQDVVRQYYIKTPGLKPEEVEQWVEQMNPIDRHREASRIRHESKLRRDEAHQQLQKQLAAAQAQQQAAAAAQGRDSEAEQRAFMAAASQALGQIQEVAGIKVPSAYAQYLASLATSPNALLECVKTDKGIDGGKLADILIRHHPKALDPQLREKWISAKANSVEQVSPELVKQIEQKAIQAYVAKNLTAQPPPAGSPAGSALARPNGGPNPGGPMTGTQDAATLEQLFKERLRQAAQIPV